MSFLIMSNVTKEFGGKMVLESMTLTLFHNLSSRVLFLKEGRKVHLDTVENIQKQYGYKLKFLEAI